MPIAVELFDNLGGSNCFSTLDLKMGYHHIQIREGNQYKLAFWGHDDIYMPLRTPFGLKIAPTLFQWLMDKVLRELRAVARAFIDDTIAHTKGFQAHWRPCGRCSRSCDCTKSRYTPRRFASSSRRLRS
jgi:hypothetical protein